MLEYQKNLNAVVLDLETTGLAAKTDKIIEIGAMQIYQGEPKETFSSLIDPGIELTERTIQITKITDEMLKGKPSFEQIQPKVSLFLQDDVLIGHNILFDYSFMKKAMINSQPKGTTFERMGIDTLRIARVVLPSLEKKTLESLCSYFGIVYQPHRALEDVKATWALFEKLMTEYYEAYPKLFEPKPLNYQVKRETPIMQKQIEQIKRLQEQYGFTMTRDLTKMTKSEASRFIDQIKSAKKAECDPLS